MVTQNIRVDLCIERAASFSYLFALREVANSATPIDLTGLDARLIVFDDPANIGTPIVTYTPLSGELTIDALAGDITFSLTATATEALAFDSALYVLEIFDPGDPTVVDKVASGCLEVCPRGAPSLGLVVSSSATVLTAQRGLPGPAGTSAPGGVPAPSVASVAPATTVAVDSVLLTEYSACKWFLNVKELAGALRQRSSEVLGTRNAAGVAQHTHTGRVPSGIGMVTFPYAVSVVISGGSLELRLTNTHTVAVSVDAVRLGII